MFENTYKAIQRRIEPGEPLMQHTLRAAQRTYEPAPRPRRALAFALALMMCLGLGTSALAASSTAFNEWLYTVFPGWAMYFRPVQMACEDQGLRMEVAGVHIMGRQADILITLTDLTGDRLDESLDLFDSYGLDTPGHSSASCEFVGYDQATRSAAFRIRYAAEVPIRSDKLTFTLRRLLTGKEATAAKLYLPLSEYSSSPGTHLPGERIRGWGGHADLNRDAVYRQALLLPRKDMAVLAPGATLTAAGYVDGRLRVQMRYDDILHTDNHGFLWLEDVHGKRIDSTMSVSYWAENGADSYEEYFFDASAEDVQGYALCGEFFTCDTLIEGNWTVTFPLDAL